MSRTTRTYRSHTGPPHKYWRKRKEKPTIVLSLRSIRVGAEWKQSTWQLVFIATITNSADAFSLKNQTLLYKTFLLSRIVDVFTPNDPTKLSC